MITPHFEFKNKVVFITGGTGAIGQEIAQVFLREGAKVILFGRNSKNSINHRNCSFIYLDFLKQESIKNIVQSAIYQYKKIDILINCAGGGARNSIAPLHLQDEQIIKEVLISNLESTIFMTKYIIPHMIKNEYGKIINFSSVVGIKGQKNYSEYSAAKSAIIGFTKSIAIELAPYNINVNCITPGYIPRNVNLTEQNKVFYQNKNILKQVPTTNKIAEMTLFLCQEKCNFITGENIIIDGGYLLK